MSKVPVLGDLPLFGELFRSTSSETERSTVIVFLRPKIVQAYSGLNMPKDLLDRYEDTTVEIKPERSLQEKSPSQDIQDKQYPSKQKSDEEYKKKWKN